MALFSELHAQGLTVAVITHDDAVARRAQRIVRIRDGVVDGGTPTGTAALVGDVHPAGHTSGGTVGGARPPTVWTDSP
jgi:ABC-type lipoprotein export system ATPase subunit